MQAYTYSYTYTQKAWIWADDVDAGAFMLVMLPSTADDLTPFACAQALHPSNPGKYNGATFKKIVAL